MSRVERDRHFSCEPGKCVAPTPKRLTRNYVRGACIPRRVWWLRTTDSQGRRVSRAFRTESEAREFIKKVEAARTLGQDYALVATKASRKVGRQALRAG